MAKSYTIGRNLYGTFYQKHGDSKFVAWRSTAKTTTEQFARSNWPFLERLRTLTTIASTQFYNLPYDCDQVREIAVIVSSKDMCQNKRPTEHSGTN